MNIHPERLLRTVHRDVAAMTLHITELSEQRGAAIDILPTVALHDAVKCGLLTREPSPEVEWRVRPSTAMLTAWRGMSNAERAEWVGRCL